MVSNDPSLPKLVFVLQAQRKKKTQTLRSISPPWMASSPEHGADCGKSIRIKTLLSIKEQAKLLKL